MAVTLVSNYAKRLGLPGYSSHQFSVSVETELTDLDRVPGEVARLYHQLQDAVDREIQQTGFVPEEGYGSNASPHPEPVHRVNGNGNGSANGYPHSAPYSPNGHENGGANWQCSPKQRQLISDLAGELGLSDQQLDERSQRLFPLVSNFCVIHPVGSVPIETLTDPLKLG
jgi:hypothetical protein